MLDGSMAEQRYKGQLITFEGVQRSGANHWTAKGQVRFSSHNSVRFFPVDGIPETFASKEEAEQCVVEAAKRLIDNLI
jgi:hypothetical protein